MQGNLYYAPQTNDCDDCLYAGSGADLDITTSQIRIVGIQIIILRAPHEAKTITYTAFCSTMVDIESSVQDGNAYKHYGILHLAR